MDRTSAQPQVNLNLLRSNSLIFQPLARHTTWTETLVLYILYVHSMIPLRYDAFSVLVHNRL
jgi:hypothetical protein